MVDSKDKSQCCGCAACESICGHKAITMEPDALGFLYPKIDATKCTQCGLCDKVCAFHQDYSQEHLNIEQTYYAARHKDLSEVEKSQSGGAFAALSELVLSQGGVIYGAGYTDHFRVVHQRATTPEECSQLRGSKYVQSDTRGIYSLIRNDLREGRKVLFSGTTCQVAAVRNFFGKKDSENLILVDIVCHGTPSPSIWHDYINHLEHKYKGEVTYFNSRDKSIRGWDYHMESFIVSGRKRAAIHYARLFFSHICLRESCHNCPYTNYQRPSDITIADFWDKHHRHPNLFPDNKGISMIFCNTERGRQLYEKIAPQLISYSIPKADTWQPNLEHPSAPHPLTPQFAEDYSHKGFLYVMKKYGDMGIKAQAKDKFIEIAVKIKHALGFKPRKR